MPSRAIERSPVEAILSVTRFERTERAHVFEATSLPGHLLHFVVSGRVRQEVSGRRYDLEPSSVMWYHEDELVRGSVKRSPWVFYSVNFVAPALSPPDYESRLAHGLARLEPAFAKLLTIWEDRRGTPLARNLQAHATLLSILADLASPAPSNVEIDRRAELWWALETELRKDLSRAVTLRTMSSWMKTSQATIARSCRHAVQVPPMKRLKQIRMSLARGLVRQSELSMTEIAARVGYARQHELSRDYRKHFGTPPTADRKR